MYRKHPNHTYGRNRNKSASNRAIAKIIKMGSLHASQKWSFSEKKNVFWIELSKFMMKAAT